MSHDLNNDQIAKKSHDDEQNYWWNALGPTILVLGDGNLAFSTTLRNMISSNNKIIATVFENRQEFLNKYFVGGGQNVLAKIEKGELENLEVCFSVDAANLSEQKWPREYITDIIMNFPQQGEKKWANKSRTMLRNLFRSISRQMVPELTCFHLTLARGQTGVAWEVVEKEQRLTESPPSLNLESWQPIQIAAEFGLRAEFVRPFGADTMKGYCPTGYLNISKASHCESEAQTITFILSYENIASKQIPLNTVNSFERYNGRLRGVPEGFAGSGDKIYHCFRPWFQYDLSILIGGKWSNSSDEVLSKLEKTLIQRIYQLAGPALVDVFERADKRSIDEQGIRNRVYRLLWQGWAIPLHRELSKSLMMDLCKALAGVFYRAGDHLKVAGHTIYDHDEGVKPYFQQFVPKKPKKRQKATTTVVQQEEDPPLKKAQASKTDAYERQGSISSSEIRVPDGRDHWVEVSGRGFRDEIPASGEQGIRLCFDPSVVIREIRVLAADRIQLSFATEGQANEAVTSLNNPKNQTCPVKIRASRWFPIDLSLEKWMPNKIPPQKDDNKPRDDENSSRGKSPSAKRTREKDSETEEDPFRRKVSRLLLADGGGDNELPEEAVEKPKQCVAGSSGRGKNKVAEQSPSDIK